MALKFGLSEKKYGLSENLKSLVAADWRTNGTMACGAKKGSAITVVSMSLLNFSTSTFCPPMQKPEVDFVKLKWFDQNTIFAIHQF